MKYLKNVLITLVILLAITIVFGSLAYINIINDKVLYIIQLLSIFVTIFKESLYLGRGKEKKGYIEGIINGTILSLLFVVINILFKKNINILKILIYITIIIISTIASIIGINKKVKD